MRPIRQRVSATRGQPPGGRLTCRCDRIKVTKRVAAGSAPVPVMDVFRKRK